MSRFQFVSVRGTMLVAAAVFVTSTACPSVNQFHPGYMDGGVASVDSGKADVAIGTGGHADAATAIGPGSATGGAAGTPGTAGSAGTVATAGAAGAAGAAGGGTPAAGGASGSGGPGLVTGGVTGPSGGGGSVAPSGIGGGTAALGGAMAASGGGNAMLASGGATGGAGVMSGGGATGGAGGAMCPATQHNCSGSCVDNNSTAHCGGLCDACTAPAGGTATCDGSKCDFTCGGAMRKCGSKCTAGCCVDADCAAQAGKTGKCDTSTNTCNYDCAVGFKPCGAGTCIPQANCCTASDCPGVCKTCSAAGACVAVTGADDTDSCPGTCDATGACKSKRGQTCQTGSGCIAGTTCAPDGYCCNTACTNSCEACDLTGFQGTCTPVATGSPHGNRTPCAGSDPTCGGSCTGRTDGMCTFTAKTCGGGPQCSGLNLVGQAMCANGSCVTPAAQSCGAGMVCSGKACVACTSGGTCQPANPCKNGTFSCATGSSVCVETTNKAMGTECGGTQMCSAGVQTNARTCNATGTCQAAVTTMCPASGCNATGTMCNPPCATGLTQCGTDTNTCYDLTSDDKHCGGCSGTGTDCSTATPSPRIVAHCRNSKCLLTDGTLCVANSDCFSGFCNLLYLDHDRDGYPSHVLSSAIHTCGPMGQSVFNYSNEGGGGALVYLAPRSDGLWDCCDQATAVHPGATQAFAWGAGSFSNDAECEASAGDTNCDGQTVLVSPTAITTSCQINASGGCDTVLKALSPTDCGTTYGSCFCDPTCQFSCGPGFPSGVSCL